MCIRDSDRAETKEDIHSVNQKESVMRMYRRPGDFISVSLLSASYEIDDVTGKLGQERDFYLKIECLQDGWASISSQVYKKEEAVTLASLFMRPVSYTHLNLLANPSHDVGYQIARTFDWAWLVCHERRQDV